MALFALFAVAALLSCQSHAAPVDQSEQSVTSDSTSVSENYPDPALKDNGDDGNYFPEEEDQRENELERLEEDLAKAETAKLLAGAIEAEQKLEAGILSSAAAVAAAGLSPGPPGESKDARARRKAAAVQEMEVLEDMVERDKRAVELIQGILGGSSGGGDAAASDNKQEDTSGSGGSGGSGGVLFSLVSSFLSGSSSSSGSAKAMDDTTTDDGSSGRQFSALGLITSSISTVLRIKFSIFRTLFSFVKGLIIPS